MGWFTFVLLVAFAIYFSRFKWLLAHDLITTDKRLRALEARAGLTKAWQEALLAAEECRQVDRALLGWRSLPRAAYIKWPPED